MRFEMHTTGVYDMDEALKKAGEIPANVRKHMVDNMAVIVDQDLVYNAASMLTGPYNQFGVARSVSRRKARATADGASAQIRFKGTQHGNRLAEIAFVNQWGTAKQPARPFIQATEKDAADPAARAAQAVLDEWMRKCGL